MPFTWQKRFSIGAWIGTCERLYVDHRIFPTEDYHEENDGPFMGTVRAPDWQGFRGNVKGDRIEWENGTTWPRRSSERSGRR